MSSKTHSRARAYEEASTTLTQRRNLTTAFMGPSFLKEGGEVKIRELRAAKTSGLNTKGNLERDLRASPKDGRGMVGPSNWQGEIS